MKSSPGGQANYTGKTFENFIGERLTERGYQFVPKEKFKITRYLEQPIYSRQFPIGKSIYETDMDCDFILYHPAKWKDCLIIECKWQQSGGSVDEKFPYLVLNIKERYPCEVVVVLDGGGYKPQAATWLRNQEGGKLFKVFNMSEFHAWANKGSI